MVEFQVAPEQLAQDVGGRPQGRVVRRELPFGEVAGEQVADRPALDAVLAGQLGRGELTAGGEHPDAGRRFGREDPGRPQQLVEVHSVAAGLALDRPHRGGQLQAIAGGNVADEAALGGQDGGDPAQRQVPGQRADLPGLALLPEHGEGARVTGPGHLAGEQLQPGAGQQPSRVGPDQVPADQQEQPGAQAAALAVAGRQPVRRGQPGDGGLPPAAAGLPGARGGPAFLPGGAGLTRQPVQHLPQAPGPLPLPVAVLQAERRGQQQGRCLLPLQHGPRPPVRAGPRRKLPHHLRALRGGRAGRDAREQERRRQPGQGAAGHEVVPNRTCSVSVR